MTAGPPLSISDATSWAQGFLRREWRLTLPVALAFMAVPALVLSQFVPELPAMTPGEVEAATAATQQLLQKTALLVVPLLVCILLGTLALSLLAAVPGISVGEALRLTLRRGPRLIAATLLAFFATVASSTLAASLVAGVLGGARAAPAQSALVTTVMILVMGAVAARFCFLPAVMTETGMTILASLKRSWQLTRGHFWRVYAMLAVLGLGILMISTIVQIVLGVLLLSIGRATGQEGLAIALLQIVLASASAALIMAAAVLLVGVYRQLASRAI